MKKRIIFGVDPGTAVTGFGVIEVVGSTFSVLDYGTIKTPTGDKLSKRYQIIYEGLLILLEKHKPDSVSVESQYMGKNVMSTIKLAMARSMVMLAATMRGIPIYQYSPTKAKLAVIGNGKATKEQIQKTLKNLLKLDVLPTPENASDALSLAICHAHSQSALHSIGEEI